MFELTVERIDTLEVSTHPTRELAHAELLRIADEAGGEAHAVDAGWTCSRYEIRRRSGDHRLTGRAVITEVCRCGHPGDDHHDGWCAGVHPDGRDCGCPAYAAEDEPAALFGTAEFLPTVAVTP